MVILRVITVLCFCGMAVYGCFKLGESIGKRMKKKQQKEG